jgi:hypothetical protein
MKLFSVLSGYCDAIRVASRAALMRVPQAAISVLIARMRYQIGPRYHSLFGLMDVPESEWKNFILDKDANPKLLAVNRHENLEWARDKNAFAAHCRMNNLPTIPIICVIDRTPSEDLAGIPRVSSAEDMEGILADAPDQLFFKLIDGAHGESAFLATRRAGEWSFEERTGTVAELYQFCMQRLEGRRGWLIQPAIAPHSELQKIMASGALGTVRAVTYLGSEGPKIMFPLLRIPAGGNVTDNFSEGTAGNIVARIDIETGVLSAGRVSRSKLWPDMVTVDTHPDTGNRIAGFRLPYWPETVDLMLKAQSRTPQLRTLGWDIAITEAGPIIVESNTGYDVNLLQVAYGRGIRQDLEPIFMLQ